MERSEIRESTWRALAPRIARSLSSGAHSRDPLAPSGLRVTASTMPRPGGRDQKRQPACDQERAAGWRGQGKKAVTGKLPQAQIARKQHGSDDEAEGCRDTDPDMHHAA